MKTLAATALAASAFMTFAAGEAGAAVLYAPTPIGSSARTSDFGDSSNSGFRSFDNFTVADGGIVQHVSWSGFWIDFGNPDPAPAPAPDVLSWEVAFYADNAGIPGAQLSLDTYAAADVDETFVGDGQFSVGSLFNVAFFDYSVDLLTPFAATAGTQFWFSVMARSDEFNPAFALRGATGGDDASYQHTLGAGLSVVNEGAVARDRAVVLEGTLPEPGTLALVGAGLLGLVAIRRRQSS